MGPCWPTGPVAHVWASSCDQVFHGVLDLDSRAPETWGIHHWAGPWRMCLLGAAVLCREDCLVQVLSICRSRFCCTPDRALRENGTLRQLCSLDISTVTCWQFEVCRFDKCRRVAIITLAANVSRRVRDPSVWQVPLHLFSSRFEPRLSGNLPSRSTGQHGCDSLVSLSKYCLAQMLHIWWRNLDLF